MSTEPVPGVGSTIGSYRIEALLGRGGMGIVYRGEDLRLGRRVALKVLRSAVADDPTYRERFLRESRLAASIEHRGNVPGLGSGVRIQASDGFAIPRELRRLGAATQGMTVSVPGVAPDAVQGDARRFVSRLEKALGEPPEQFTLYAAQGAQLLLDAIARSDGTRASVVRELFDSRVRGSVLGEFSVTDTGDTTANQVTIYRVSGGRLRAEDVITPPVSLIVRG